jgi:RNA polymerase sigma factor (sigma-70 family)
MGTQRVTVDMANARRAPSRRCARELNADRSEKPPAFAITTTSSGLRIAPNDFDRWHWLGPPSSLQGNFAKNLRSMRDICCMEQDDSDAQLLRRSVSEPAVFGELYERHGVAVRRYVVSRVGAANGEDLAAEVFIRAFRGRESCRGENGGALAWLLGVANHVISDHRRLEKRRLAALERLFTDQHEFAVEPHLGLTSEVIRALRRLPATDRDTLLLLVWGELSRDELATALGVPVGTVDSRISRARSRLASDLAPLRQLPRGDLQVNGEGSV